MLQEGERYALVPIAWARAWRKWVNSAPWRTSASAAAVAATKNSSARAPDALSELSLTDAMQALTVTVDGELRLLLEPPVALCKRSRWSQVRFAPPLHCLHFLHGAFSQWLRFSMVAFLDGCLMFC